MAILVIGAAQLKQIAKIKADAVAHPIPLSIVREGLIEPTHVLTLEQRRTLRPDFVRPKSQHMIFPGGYRVAFSVEEQPSGMCSHISISVERRQKGKLPGPEAVTMICEAFEVPFPPDRGWTEEYEPGEYAVNLVSMIDRRGLT